MREYKKITEQKIVVKTFDGLTEKERNEVIEEHCKWLTESNQYFEYRKEEFECYLDELKRERDIDFDIEFEIGASYTYIKDFKFEDITIFDDIEIEFDYSMRSGVSAYINIYDEERFLEEDIDHLEYLRYLEQERNKIVDEVLSTFLEFKDVYTWGYDENIGDYAINDLEQLDNEYEFVLETTIKVVK